MIVENLRRVVPDPQHTLFETFDGLDDGGLASVEFYKHAANWSNRLILGDSLQVMASLADRENLRGQVQTIYLDPPYGIKFGSNWQVSTRKRDVKDGKLEDATREVEQIKAFRDTWELGIHSYLAYLRDRLIVARDLLTDSGSIFVQIGDENVHLVRNLLEEVFGSGNLVSQIAFKKTGGATSDNLAGVLDYILWFGKDLQSLKMRKLYWARQVEADASFNLVQDADGTVRRRVEGDDHLPRLWHNPLTSPRPPGDFPVDLGGRIFRPGKGYWKTGETGMARLAQAGRLFPVGNTLRYLRHVSDFPVAPFTNMWDDTVTSGFGDPKVYVVQTNPKVIDRCILMTSDPGDLVLDPTCGSGTTAFVSELRGRRWITIDTSRVALALARQRIMGAKYPQYLLADSPEGRAQETKLTGAPAPDTASGNDVRKGFVYKRVPHVTLKSIANNPDIVEGMTREQIDAAIARHAETELLYDQPYEDKSKIRVAGPFTVESVSPHRAFDDETDLPASQTSEDDTTTFEQMLLDNLRASGVQNGRRPQRFEFDEVERIPGKYLTARATPKAELAADRVAVSIGPRYGTVGSDWIKQAAREAMKGVGHDVLLVLGFAFDPRALETVEEFKPEADEGFAVQTEHRVGGIRVLLVRMNPDLAMGTALLKKSKAANLFTVFGEPDILPPFWTPDGWRVTIRGFDVYNPVTGEVRAGGEDEIAMWMLDTDYDEESFFVRHAYFLGTDPYERLKKALKAEIDPDAWETLNSATSRPFPHPKSGKIAIKVINHYGDELLTVLDLPNPPEEKGDAR
ncbi:MAG: site-specific DNA-methyltransferase [Sporichthyaceae bacterium]